MKPLPNAMTKEKTFSMEYLDRSFLPALNSIGQHEFKGVVAYAFYRNSKTVDGLIRNFQREINAIMRSHAENDGRGGIATETDATGNQKPKFRSEEDRRTYMGIFHKMFRETPVTVRLQMVSEQDFDEAVLSLDGGISSNVLSTLRPMVDDDGDEQDTKVVPMSVVKEENIPSGPEVINASEQNNGNADVDGQDNGQDDLPQPAQEPAAGAVLE